MMLSTLLGVALTAAGFVALIKLATNRAVRRERARYEVLSALYRATLQDRINLDTYEARREHARAS